MTIRQFRRAREGYEERQVEQYRRDAWRLAWQLQPHTKKGRSLQPNDLLPEEFQTEGDEEEGEEVPDDPRISTFGPDAKEALEEAQRREQADGDDGDGGEGICGAETRSGEPCQFPSPENCPHHTK